VRDGAEVLAENNAFGMMGFAKSMVWRGFADKRVKVFLKRELPCQRNVLEYRPVPAAKRDVWITARPHEPVLAK
jgi:hypothetical protein